MNNILFLLKKCAGFFSNLINGSIIKNIFTMMSGTILAQALSFAASPILTRLYTPDEFGTLAVFVGIISIGVVVSSWRYELAIVLPADDDDARAICYLSVIITSFMSLFSWILIFLNTTYFEGYFVKTSIFFRNVIPLGIFCGGLLNILSYFCLRRANYKVLSISKFIQSFITISIQIFLPMFYENHIYIMITGVLLGQIIAIIILIPYIGAIKLQAANKIVKVANHYKNLPLFSTWSACINIIALQMPCFLLLHLYSSEVVGFFSLAQRVIQVPYLLLGNSISQIYYQTISKMNQQKQSIYNFTKSITQKNLVIGFFPVLIFGAFGPETFTWIFGSEWVEAGKYAGIMVGWLYWNFVGSSISMILVLFFMQKFEFMFNFTMLMIQALSIYAGYYFYRSSELSITFLSISGAIIYAYLTYYLISEVKAKAKAKDKDNLTYD